jgi:dihydropyrimidine dehydrogenase (NAD+) subunit PreT
MSADAGVQRLRAMDTVTGSSALYEELSPPLSREAALLEADRCLECGDAYAEAPCVTACPAAVDVPGFVAAIARDAPEKAAATIFQENLLGGTCARVCPVETLCQGACVLAHEGRRPIEIARLQRFAADAALHAGLPLRRSQPRNWYRISVIGAGPAGLVCAGELAARGFDVTVYDERCEPGGLARFAIAPYRLQREPLPEELRGLARLGVKFELGVAIDTRDALAYLESFSDAVVLAVGMGDDADVPYPGDGLAGIWNSLPFIEAIKTGTPPAIGDSVVVIGGGNTAVDVAREAIRLGAATVTMVYRRTRAEMPAYAHEVDQACEEGVRLEWLTVPVRLVGTKTVEAVECRRCRLGALDSTGRRRPEEMPGTEFLLPATTVVKAVGQRPRTELFGWIDGLELERGRVKVDPATGQTTNPKYFAAGDATNGGATVVEAVREAKIAARGVDALVGKRAA